MASTLIDYAAMNPDLARRGVVEVFVEDVPILRELMFIDIGDAFQYQYDVEASLGGIGFRSLNGEYSAAAKKAGTTSRLYEGTAIMGGEVPIDRQMAGNAAYKANKVAMKAKAAGRFFARQFIDGSIADDPKGFDGLNVRLQNDNVVSAGANGGYLSLAVLDKMLAQIPGENAQKVLLMGAMMQVNLGTVLRSQGATAMGLAEWGGDRTPQSYNGARIVLVGEDESGNEILGFDEAQGSSGVTGSIYPARLGKSTDGEYLQGIARRAEKYGVFEIEDRGQTATADNTVVEGRLGLTIHHGRSVKRYKGIKEGVAS